MTCENPIGFETLVAYWLGEVPEKELIKRGLVRDVLSTEYDARVKLHPKTPPVPGGK